MWLLNRGQSDLRQKVALDAAGGTESESVEDLSYS